MRGERPAWTRRLDMPALYNAAAVFVFFAFLAWVVGTLAGGLVSLEITDLVALLDDSPTLELSHRTP